ncbi:hypothetical protein HHK36_027669 [Tetracentron sinense]|uniref:BTB domain-containing protein n=1 Tax=Tetracentron sinense TaxID=13715 RepID=A0A835D1G0_TETSI|nr:hypothetical protein HHK36_027669 [Tetracentron sinense]
MAAAVHHKTQPTKSKRRKCRETTISATATSSTTTLPDPSAGDLSLTHHHKHNPLAVVTPYSSWCCAAAKTLLSPSPSPRPPPPLHQQTRIMTSTTTTLNPPRISNHDHDHDHDDEPETVSGTVTLSSSSPSQSPSTFKLTFSPGKDSSVTATVGPGGSVLGSYPSSYCNFNSALTAGLLNPMSPPPPVDKTRSSLFEMMASEPDWHPRSQILSNSVPVFAGNPPITVQDKQVMLQQRMAEIVGSCSPGNQFNDPTSSDVKLTLSSKDELSVSMNLHRQILVDHSEFFAAKLSDRWLKQQRSPPYIIDISDCDDVDIYIKTLRLMYCEDLRKNLMKEDVSTVLGILKVTLQFIGILVSAAIEFDAGVLSCLEYLEAAPWAEDEEEKVALLLSQLHLEGAGAGDVLKRVSIEVTAGPEEGNNNEEVLLRLLQVVLEGKNEKARREMKGLVLKMLRENASHNDISKESLYLACEGCLQLLRLHFLSAASLESHDIGQIARQADNLHWILDILIDRQIAEDFLKTWAAQSELSEAHFKVPAIHRYEVSRITARLFVGIGKGQLLASKEVRCLLLRTWLVPFYDDFKWIRRAPRGLDRNLIEDGLSNTILTLPLAWQQEILLSWFDRFLNSGEDCPNIQRGFEVWWRRAFWRRNGEPELPCQLRIMAASCENS